MSSLSMLFLVQHNPFLSSLMWGSGKRGSWLLQAYMMGTLPIAGVGFPENPLLAAGEESTRKYIRIYHCFNS
jgi:hypothetical protein